LLMWCPAFSKMGQFFPYLLIPTYLR
jgi:hypothetical protein